jgi:Methane oxygenase PmoA
MDGPIMPRSRAIAAATVLCFATVPIPRATFAATFTLDQTERGITVKLGGRLFTEYLIRSGNKPILWPINGPDGVGLTRDYPMESVAGESHDHPHHRSLWFTHGSVDGIDFWGESAGGGEIRHRKFADVQSGTVGRIVALDDWLDHAGRRICQDRRTLVFRASDDRRSIDFDIRLIASDGRVVFRDTKEGSFGLRVADWLKADPPGHGQIISSRGQKNSAAWGQRADWVDYHAPHDGETLGIAILNHPSSFRYPTYWHVRTYGLFAANPFGSRALSGSKNTSGSLNTADGSVSLDPGKALTFRYRVLLHRGDEKQSHIAEAFAEYSKEQIND